MSRAGIVSGQVPLAVRRLGKVAYRDALAIQDELVRNRRDERIPDTLLLLQHPHVITLGSSSDPSHVLASPDQRASLGIELFEAGRGGDVTYHGPGQLIGYPIVALEKRRHDFHRYLRDLEGALIDGLAELGVQGHRLQGLTGVWTSGGKIAAIGVRISSGWITSHGFALNVAPDLSYFATIVPCGIEGRAITSLALELGHTVAMTEVENVMAVAVAERLGRRIFV
jgi:lipoyl(octanoyl) transferase